MYYVVWFDDNNSIGPLYAYTSNIVHLKNYIHWVTTVVNPNNPGAYYEECKTIDEVKETLARNCKLNLSGDHIDNYELMFQQSQTRPELYTLVTTKYETETFLFLDYNGEPNVYNMAKLVSQLMEATKRFLNKTPLSDRINKGIKRVSDYLYAYGVIEECYGPLSEGAKPEKLMLYLASVSDEVNIDILNVMDMDNGFGIIEYREYINMYVEQLWVNGRDEYGYG